MRSICVTLRKKTNFCDIFERYKVENLSNSTVRKYYILCITCGVNDVYESRHIMKFHLLFSFLWYRYVCQGNEITIKISTIFYLQESGYRQILDLFYPMFEFKPYIQVNPFTLQYFE